MRYPPWTAEDALAAGRRFVAQHGTLPKATDLQGCYGLSSGRMIRHLCGSLRQCQGRLAPELLPVPAPARRRPGARRVGWGCPRGRARLHALRRECGRLGAQGARGGG